MTATSTTWAITVLLAGGGAELAWGGAAHRTPPAIPNAGGPAYLVKDIAMEGGLAVPYPGFVAKGTASGSFVYFIGDDPSSSQQLWRTDGTQAGTEMVASLQTGSSPNGFSYLTDFSGILFFVGNYDLWRSDGSASGTTRVHRFPPNGRPPRNLTALPGALYFVANDGSGTGLWRSDGTPAGTTLVRSFSNIASLAAVGSTLFLVADDGVSGAELWKSDGTAAGTSMVIDLCPGSCSYFIEPRLTASGGRIYFVAQTGQPDQLFVTDGTSAGTLALSTTASSIQSLTDVNGTLFFTAYDSQSLLGDELWKSNGTPGATAPVKDIFPGGSSSPSELTNVNGTLYFTADDGVHGRELWKTDGSDPGTVMVLDINPNPAGPSPGGLVAVGSRLFFFADDGVHGYELWTSDGTAGGTTLVKDICPGACRGTRLVGTPLGATSLVFGADDGSTGPTFWVSDGTAPGTLPLGHTVNAPAGIGSILAAGNAVYFGANNYLNGGTWRSDGTPAGTIKLTTQVAEEIVEIGGTIFFSATDGGVWSLERTDGTPAGTTFLLTGVFDIHSLTALNGTLLFVATTQNEGEELWRSDGTPAGTRLLVDLRPGPGGSMPSSLARIGDQVFFQAYALPDTGLWKTDGTAAGTVLVKAPLLASEIVDVGGVAYFAGQDDFRTGLGAGLEIWRSDGTPAGTFLLKDMSPGPTSSQLSFLTDVDGRLFFVAYTTDDGPEVWTSDGTTAGTHQVKDIMPGPSGSDPVLLRNVEGTLLFFASDGVHGRELWRSDGTAAGTVMVKDIAVGPDSSVESPEVFAHSAAATGGILYFGAWTQASGQELWRTDGTAGGTLLVQDIAPGASSSNPDLIAFAGSFAFFTADDDVHGTELWAMPLVTPSLSIGDGETYEGSTGTTPLPFPVTLWPPTGQTVSVAYASHDGSAQAGVDYVATSGTLTFAPGQTQATINVPVIGDSVVEPDEFFVVDLASPANATVGKGEGIGRIRDGTAPVVDLAITKSDGQDAASPSQSLTYAIVATNNGPGVANGAVVTDVVPSTLTSATWTCTGSNGGSCTASGAGAINDTVNLPAGGSVSYALTGMVAGNASRVVNTATVTVPVGMSDPNPANNTARDTDVVVCSPQTVVVVPDGRVSTSSIAGGATVWFGSTLKLGDSYSLEFKNLTDAGLPPGVPTLFAGDDGCSGISSVSVRDTTMIDPGGDPASRRLSFTATGADTFFRIQLANGAGSAIPYSFSLSDTALYSPAWSTNGAFDTFYAFANTTGTVISGTLTLLDTAGAPLSTFNLTIPAGQAVATNTTALSVARNLTGTARFTHDGPPGAVVGEAAIANFNSSPAYVQPVKFEGVREAR